MKLLTKQQALKAYLSGYAIVYEDKGKFKQVYQSTRLNTSNEYYVLGARGIKMIKFNMNNYVWFEPTELGEKVYSDYFTQLGFEEPHNKLKIVDGKAKLQFHNFIHIYGDYITSYICKDKEVFKYYEFYIDEENLV